jgi:hypothetical protein
VWPTIPSRNPSEIRDRGDALSVGIGENCVRRTHACSQRRPAFAYLDDALDSAGGRREIIPIRRRRELLQEWRHVYAAGLHAATGKWTWLGFDWHVFSYNHARALAQAKAWFAYATVSPPARYFVCPHDEALPAFEIVEASLPDFRNSGLDIYVWPEGLTWTMAFTHEDGWLGPYFSRREWVTA